MARRENCSEAVNHEKQCREALSAMPGMDIIGFHQLYYFIALKTISLSPAAMQRNVLFTTLHVFELFNALIMNGKHNNSYFFFQYSRNLFFQGNTKIYQRWQNFQHFLRLVTDFI